MNEAGKDENGLALFEAVSFPSRNEASAGAKSLNRNLSEGNAIWNTDVYVTIGDKNNTKYDQSDRAASRRRVYRNIRCGEGRRQYRYRSQCAGDRGGDYRLETGRRYRCGYIIFPNAGRLSNIGLIE